MLFWKKGLSLGETEYKGGVLPRQKHLLQGMDKWLQETWEECRIQSSYKCLLGIGKAQFEVWWGGVCTCFREMWGQEAKGSIRKAGLKKMHHWRQSNSKNGLQEYTAGLSILHIPLIYFYRENCK